MGTFTDSVVGNDDKLVRNAIRSTNYVAGSAGWKISKDGTAEFSDVTVRGDVVASSFATGVAPAARVVIQSTTLGTILIYAANAGFYSLRMRAFLNGGTQYVGAIETENIHPSEGRPRLTLWNDSSGGTHTQALLDIETGPEVLLSGDGVVQIDNGAGAVLLFQSSDVASLVGSAVTVQANSGAATLAASGAASVNGASVGVTASSGDVTVTASGDALVSASGDATVNGATAGFNALSGAMQITGATTLTVVSDGAASFGTSGGSGAAATLYGEPLTLTGNYVTCENLFNMGTNQDIQMNGGVIKDSSNYLKFHNDQIDMTYATIVGGGPSLFSLQDDGNAVIYQSSTAVWNAGTAISDARVKRNIVDLPTGSVLDIIRQIRPVSYEYDPDKFPAGPTGTRWGFVAQELGAAFPQAVTDIRGSLLLDTNTVAVLALAGVHDLLATIGLNPAGRIGP